MTILLIVVFPFGFAQGRLRGEQKIRIYLAIPSDFVDSCFLRASSSFFSAKSAQSVVNLP